MSKLIDSEFIRQLGTRAEAEWAFSTELRMASEANNQRLRNSQVLGRRLFQEALTVTPGQTRQERRRKARETAKQREAALKGRNS